MHLNNVNEAVERAWSNCSRFFMRIQRFSYVKGITSLSLFLID